jgi:hypothetical protein
MRPRESNGAALASDPAKHNTQKHNSRSGGATQVIIRRWAPALHGVHRLVARFDGLELAMAVVFLWVVAVALWTLVVLR